MSHTGTHAKKELEILFKQSPTALIKDFEDEILAVCEKFGNTGQSGGSAPYTARALSMAIEKLCLQKTIAPTTGEDDEWNDVSEMNGGEKLFQNKRDSAIFKYDDGKCRYVDAIVKVTQNDSSWSGPFWLSKEDYLTGNKDLMVRCSGLIKSFPFTPKTFYIDVIEEEIAKDDWEMFLKDPKQLEEYYEYYDRE